MGGRGVDMRGHGSSDRKTDSKCQDGRAGNWDLQRRLLISSFTLPIKVIDGGMKYSGFLQCWDETACREI